MNLTKYSSLKSFALTVIKIMSLQCSNVVIIYISVLTMTRANYEFPWLSPDIITAGGDLRREKRDDDSVKPVIGSISKSNEVVVMDILRDPHEFFGGEVELV